VGLLARLIEARSSPENPRTPLSNPDEWLWDALGAQRTEAGISVTPKTALYSAAFACGNVLAQSVAQLPWDVYQRSGENRERVQNEIDYLLHNEPNPEMTSYSFRYAMVMRCCFHGRFHAEIERNGAGRVRYLWPLFEKPVEQLRDVNKRLIGYKYGDRRIPLQNVIHVPCIPLDGTEGESILSQARNKIALELAAEKFGSKLFSQGTRPSGVLESDQTLKSDARKELSREWQALWAGTENAMKTPVLTGGLKWKQLSINPDDAQFLETRDFQVSDIARFFRVPGVLIGITDKTATYASVEQFLLSFAKFTLAPWLVAIEQEFNRKLFPSTVAMYSKLDMRGMERGDLKSRAEFYKTMSEIGPYTANKILSLEDENGFEGGDVHMQPLNWGPYGKVAPAQSATSPEPGTKRSDPFRTFRPLLESAITAIAKTRKRDAEWIKSRCEPILRSLMIDQNGSAADVNEFMEKLCIRAQEWTPEAIDDELRKMILFARGEVWN
jgi:HK97 family phage portal protein